MATQWTRNKAIAWLALILAVGIWAGVASWRSSHRSSKACADWVAEHPNGVVGLGSPLYEACKDEPSWANVRVVHGG